MNRVVTLRPITAKDSDFLYRVYASTREDELAPLGWDAAQKASFLEMQFAAQHKFYQELKPEDAVKYFKEAWKHARYAVMKASDPL